MKYPLPVLRLESEAYCGPRRLTFRGAVAEAVVSHSAIVAGSGAATDVLFLATVPLIDRLVAAARPSTTFGLIVDDLSIQVRGSQAHVVGELLAVTDQAVQGLEERGFIVSRGKPWKPGLGKTICTSSSQEALKRLDRAAKARGLNTKTSVRHLGVDFGQAAKKREQPVLGARKTVAKKKAGRIAALTSSRRIRKRMATATVATTLAYGAATVGRTDRQLEHTDAVAHALLGKLAGRSAYARLTLQLGALASESAAVAAPAA